MEKEEAIRILKHSNELLKEHISELSDKFAAPESKIPQKKSFYDCIRNARAEYAAVELAVAALEKPDEVRVKTPVGTLLVQDKLDPDYPGINVFLAGEQANDKFTGNGKETVAMIEFDGEKQKLQAVVYGDGEAEDFTDLVEYRNLLKK